MFRTLQSEAALTGAGPRVEKLSELISSSWISFAKLGTPEAEGFPLWPRYEPARRATMIFDDMPFLADGPDGADRERLMPLWNAVQAVAPG